MTGGHMTLLKRATKSIGQAAVVILALTVHASTSTARALGSFGGNPLDNSSLTCFSELNGGVTGTGAAGCVGIPFADSPRWEVELPIETLSASASVTIFIRGNGSIGPTCSTYWFNQDTGVFAVSNAVTNATTSYIGEVMTVNINGAGGYMALACGHLTSSSTAIGGIHYSSNTGTFAESLGAFTGHPLDNSSSACFGEHAGGVTGTGAAGCVGHPFTDSPRWEVQLPNQTAGSKTINVSIKGNGTSGPTCTAYLFEGASLMAESATVTNATTSFVTKSMSLFIGASDDYVAVVCGHLSSSSTDVGLVTYSP
jgi:hypothetical protein